LEVHFVGLMYVTWLSVCWPVCAVFPNRYCRTAGMPAKVWISDQC